MSSVNKAILIGHLGQDPDIRQTNSGSSVANFSLATSKKYKDQQGEWKTKTEWHRVVVFGKSAEFVGNYFRKGTKAYVEGEITTKEWEDREGNKKKSTEIVVLPYGGSVQSLEKIDKDGGGTTRTGQDSVRRGGGGGGNADLDDDIPF